MAPGTDLPAKTVHLGDEAHRLPVKNCRLVDGWWRGVVSLYGQLRPVEPVGHPSHYHAESQHPSSIERWRVMEAV